MSLYEKTLQYFYELSEIPRVPMKEEKVRKWLKKWAKNHHWEYEMDTIGNILIRAPGKNNTTLLCLQAHMDMVCVSNNKHDFEKKGITILDDGEKLHTEGTTLGADNGIGVAIMMAYAEEEFRPSLELLFTVGEEIGLVGAYDLEVPVTAPYGLNLDWCDSENIGIGCGGILFMESKIELERKRKASGKIMKIKVTGMKGGHSGVNLQEKRGNAIVELTRIIQAEKAIHSIAEMRGGDADNSLPRSARAIVLVTGRREEIERRMEKREKRLQKQFHNPHITISLEEVDKKYKFHEKGIMKYITQVGSGTQKKDPSGEMLSSWNLGKIQLKKGVLKWCYFLRTNEKNGLNRMRRKITKGLEKYEINWEIGNEIAAWANNPESEFVQSILTSVREQSKKYDLPAVVMHATMEAGILAEKYPDTEWVSMGATVYNMHSIHEHIYKKDLEEFCHRLERVVLEWRR